MNVKTKYIEPLVISEAHAAKLLGLTLADFRRARLAGKITVRPLPISKGKQALYYKDALIQWLNRESGFLPDASFTDWDQIIRERIANIKSRLFGAGEKTRTFTPLGART